ncbi:hypothetical protein CSPX01_06101 [Colletotrichum filicis]|nr:hypothetical protein CSPX01_06101 [Colletotrichum filicis]
MPVRSVASMHMCISRGCKWSVYRRMGMRDGNSMKVSSFRAASVASAPFSPLG